MVAQCISPSFEIHGSNTSKSMQDVDEAVSEFLSTFPNWAPRECQSALREVSCKAFKSQLLFENFKDSNVTSTALCHEALETLSLQCLASCNLLNKNLSSVLMSLPVDITGGQFEGGCIHLEGNFVHEDDSPSCPGRLVVPNLQPEFPISGTACAHPCPSLMFTPLQWDRLRSQQLAGSIVGLLGAMITPWIIRQHHKRSKGGDSGRGKKGRVGLVSPSPSPVSFRSRFVRSSMSFGSPSQKAWSVSMRRDRTPLSRHSSRNSSYYKHSSGVKESAASFWATDSRRQTPSAHTTTSKRVLVGGLQSKRISISHQLVILLCVSSAVVHGSAIWESGRQLHVQCKGNARGASNAECQILGATFWFGILWVQVLVLTKACCTWNILSSKTRIKQKMSKKQAIARRLKFTLLPLLGSLTLVITLLFTGRWGTSLSLSITTGLCGPFLSSRLVLLLILYIPIILCEALSLWYMSRIVIKIWRDYHSSRMSVSSRSGKQNAIPLRERSTSFSNSSFCTNNTLMRKTSFVQDKKATSSKYELGQQSWAMQFDLRAQSCPLVLPPTNYSVPNEQEEKMAGASVLLRKSSSGEGDKENEFSEQKQLDTIPSVSEQETNEKPLEPPTMQIPVNHKVLRNTVPYGGRYQKPLYSYIAKPVAFWLWFNFLVFVMIILWVCTVPSQNMIEKVTDKFILCQLQNWELKEDEITRFCGEAPHFNLFAFFSLRCFLLVYHSFFGVVLFLLFGMTKAKKLFNDALCNYPAGTENASADGLPRSTKCNTLLSFVIECYENCYKRLTYNEAEDQRASWVSEISLGQISSIGFRDRNNKKKIHCQIPDSKSLELGITEVSPRSQVMPDNVHKYKFTGSSFSNIIAENDQIFGSSSSGESKGSSSAVNSMKANASRVSKYSVNSSSQSFSSSAQILEHSHDSQGYSKNSESSDEIPSRSPLCSSSHSDAGLLKDYHQEAGPKRCSSIKTTYDSVVEYLPPQLTPQKGNSCSSLSSYHSSPKENVQQVLNNKPVFEFLDDSSRHDEIS